MLYHSPDLSEIETEGKECFFLFLIRIPMQKKIFPFERVGS